LRNLYHPYQLGSKKSTSQSINFKTNVSKKHKRHANLPRHKINKYPAHNFSFPDMASVMPLIRVVEFLIRGRRVFMFLSSLEVAEQKQLIVEINIRYLANWNKLI